MKFALLAAFALTSLAQDQTEGFRAEEKLLFEEQDPPQGDVSSLRARERRALELAGDSASRSGNTLTIRLASGETRSFTDAKACAQPDNGDCIRFRLVAHVQSKQVFVVFQLNYEDVYYRLIHDQTGEQTVFSAAPNFSESGAHVIVCLSSPYAGFEVQAWRRDGNRFIQEWTATPFLTNEGGEYRFIRWLNDESAELEIQVGAGRGKGTKRRFVVNLVTRKWATVR